MIMRISEVLNITPGVTSIIGGGGKTTLMLTLARELSDKGTVIILTTTRIFPPEGNTLVTSTSKQEVSEKVKEQKVVCVSEGVDDNGKLLPPTFEIKELMELADYIICEADGAKRLPLKAHLDYESVAPQESSQTILVVGIDGIGKAIKDTCHRPKLYAELAGCSEDNIVTPEVAMTVINKEELGTRIFINKVESNDQMEIARKMSGLTSLPVIAGSLMNGEYKCL